MPPILEEKEMGSSEMSFSENPKNNLAGSSDFKSKSLEKDLPLASSDPIVAN